MFENQSQFDTVDDELINNRSLFWAGIALIAAAAAIVYIPCISGGFIWDDSVLLTQNLQVKAPDGLYRIWFTTEPVDYWPVSYTSFWLEWRLWGMHPTGYHVTNLLLHIVDSLLVWLVLWRMKIPGAFLAGLLFAVHPINVESVAWIAQRKNVLSLLFYLLSIVCYLTSEQRRHEAWSEYESDHVPIELNHWYWLSLLAFLLAMLSKGSVAMLPPILLLIVWWQRGRIQQNDIVRTVPFFVVAGALTIVNISFQSHGLAVPLRDVTPLARLLGAGAVVWFYLWKAVWPWPLIFVYPKWDIRPDELRWWLPLAAMIFVTAFLIWKRRTVWGRTVLFAWAYFCLALLPVMGFTDVGYMKISLVADHYVHIALIGVVALAAAVWSNWYSRHESVQKWPLAVPITAVLGLSVLSLMQTGLYADASTLYTATLERNPDSWDMHTNLGVILVANGKLSEAMEHYRKAIQLKPDFSEAYNDLGIVLAQAGNLSEAIDQFKLALKYNPKCFEAHTNLGFGLALTGHPEDGIEELKKSLELNPHYALAEFDWGDLLSRSGHFDEAIVHYQAALKIDPDLPGAHAHLAAALERLGRFDEALDHCQQAAVQNPDNAQAQANLAMAYAQVGKQTEAVATAQDALRLARSTGQIELARQLETWLSTNGAQ